MASKLFDDYLQFSTPGAVVVKETSSNNNELAYSTNVPVTRTGIATATNTSIAIDGQQNVYLTGTYNSGTNVPIYNLTGSSAGFFLPSTTTVDSFMIKYDKTGIAKSWTKIFNSLASIGPTVIYNGLDSVYWTGNFKNTNAILNFNTGNGLSMSSGMTLGQLATSTSYNTFIIKYDVSSGSARSFNWLTGLLDIVPTYSYITGQNVYVSGYYNSSCSVYDFGTSSSTSVALVMGNLPNNQSESGYLIRYQSDQYNSSAIIRGTGPSTAIVRPTCITSDSNYLYASGYHNCTTSAFSFTGIGTVGSTSSPFLFSSGTDKAFITRWLIQDGSIESSSYLNTSGSYFKSLAVIGSSIYASGIYNTASSLYNFNTVSSMSLPAVAGTNNPFIIKWSTSTGGVTSFTTIRCTSSTSSGLSLATDYNESLYVCGSYLSVASVAIINFYTGGSTSSALSLSLPVSNGSVFMIKYASDIGSTYNTITGGTMGSLTVGPSGSLYSTGSYTGTIGVTNFQASGSLYTVGTTGSYLASWSNDGQAIYQVYPLLLNIQEPIAPADVVSKSYIDGSYEYLTVSGSGASISPNVITVLEPPELNITTAVSPVLYNSSPSGLAIDSITGTVYLSGTYFGFSAPVYNKDGTYAFNLPPTLAGPSAFVLKYSVNGLALASTTIQGARAGQLTLDNSGYVYCSGSYDSSISVNVYDFSTSSIMGISRAIMPATGANYYVIRWSGAGLFDSWSCSQSYSQIGSLNIDTTGALYSPINQPVSVIANFSNNSVVSGYTSFMQSTGTFSHQGAKLVGTGGSATAFQGTSCSIYKNTAVSGANNDNNGVGATWVFSKSGTLWSQQGLRLVGTGSVGTSRQGASCSIYEDTIVSGARGDNSNAGAIFVFTRTGTTWAQLQPKLVGSGGVTTGNQGRSCSIYKDTIASGGEGDNGSQGAVWVYTRGLTSGTFSQQGSKLVGTGNTGAASQGFSCSVYEDTIVSGGNTDNSSQGAVWVFTRTGTTWTQQGLKLVGSGTSGTTAAAQGQSCSVYKDTIVEGGINDNNNQGAVWIFTRSNGSWTQQGPKLVGNGVVGSSRQGNSCSIYEDTVISGGVTDNSDRGAIWIFTRIGTTWTQLGSKLVGLSTTTARQGTSCSIYKNIIVDGGTGDNSNQGAIYLFENNSTALTKWTGPSWDVQAVAPIRNFISTSLTTDSLNNVYCAGSYTNTMPITVYNLQNITSPFSLPQTDGAQTPSTIIKWSASGTAIGFTQLNFCTNVILATDTQNNLYCSGYYNNTTSVVPVMNFSSGTGTVSPFSLPISIARDTFIIKWSSTGTAKSFNVLRGTGIDGTVTGLCTDLNDSVYLSSTYTSTTPVSLYNMSETTGALGMTRGSLSANVTAGSWTFTGSMNTARSYCGSCLLNDGRVLVGGGQNISSCEIYNPVTGTWSPAASMPYALSSVTFILLQNGDVLAPCGDLNNDYSLRNSIVYNVSANTWTTVGMPSVTRANYGSALLNDGRVLIGYGWNGVGFLSTCELYNPLLKTWRTTGSLAGAAGERIPFYNLPNGRVLFPGKAVTTSFTQIYDPNTEVWTAVSNIPDTRQDYGTCMLQNSDILVMGGSGTFTNGSYSYNYSKNIWSTITNPVSTLLGGYGIYHCLPNGLVLLAGGVVNSLTSSTSYLYNPVTGTWSNTGAMNVARRSQSVASPISVLLKDGRVLAFGGLPGPLSTCEIYQGADVTQAIIKWSSNGSLERYQTYVGTSNYALQSNMPGLAVDATGALNMFGSSGSSVQMADAFVASTSGQTSVPTRYTVDTLSAYSNVSQLPGSCVYAKWSVSGLVNIDPYAQDFNVQVPDGTIGSGQTKVIIADTQNYNYKMNGSQLAQGYNDVYWNGSYWTT